MTQGKRTDNYLEQLGKWQAVSNPELAESKPEELFGADDLRRYKSLHDNLLWRLIRLHGTLCTLEELREFPFEYVYGAGQMEFWRLVAANFIETAILKLDSLVNYRGEDVHSLISFRSEILKMPWRVEAQDKLQLLRRTLKERKFDAHVSDIAQRVKKIRNNHIAHELMDRDTGAPKEVIAGISLEELWQLFDAAHSLFGALSFGAGYVTLAGDLMPGTVGGKKLRTCLERVLDAVLRDSSFVNRPERRAQWWPEERKHIDAHQLQVMNEMRIRVGLAEA